MQDTVISERRGPVAILTLNRPQALNALDLQMLTAIRRTLREWQSDATVKAVFLQGAGRAFCAGGDVKAVALQRHDAAFLDEVYRVEYEVDHLLHTFGRPVVPLMHGITMGGGCGIALHASHPVASDDLTLAMPETAIGFFPDVAGTHFLSRCPDSVGRFMALTGARIGAADTVEFGLGRAIVPRERHVRLIARVASGEDVDRVIADEAVSPMPQMRRLGNREEIASAFGNSSVQEILQVLERQGSDWAVETRSVLERQCPFSLALTLRAFNHAAGRSVADVLALDFRVAQRLTMRNDYSEGVRARLVDRDGDPRWSPARLDEVNADEVEACFAPLDSPELWMSAASG